MDEPDPVLLADVLAEYDIVVNCVLQDPEEPLMFAKQEDLERYESFMGKLVELIVGKYDGSLKAEHGTGVNMAPYVEREWGARATEMMWRVKALADPVRLRLLSLVASHDGGEACICDLNEAFDLSQPTISHHMKVLHEAGLVDRDKRGVWVYYRVRSQVLASLAALIGSPVP